MRVFISYAHESDAHVEAVRELWIVLRTLGVDAKLDLPAAEQRQDWPLWMAAELRAADFILVVASPAYRRRAEGTAEPDDGRGVQFEAGLIREKLYRDRAAGMATVLPVLLPGMSRDDIPEFLGPTTATSYGIESITPAGVERLVRVLTGQPWETEPPLGDLAVLPLRSAAPRNAVLSHELVLDVECGQGRVRCRAVLAGSLLSECEGPVPFGMDEVWRSLSGAPDQAQLRLADAGRRLREALLDDTATSELTALLDGSRVGTIVEIVIVADGAALELPFELMRLPDGRLLATVPGVRMRRRVRGLERTATDPLPSPLKILVAVGAPEETRTASAPLDVEAEMEAILDAVAGIEGVGVGQARILEVASPEQIAEALAADEYHVLHLSAHGSPTGVELEDEDGNPVPVGAAELVGLLRGGGRPLPLIVLSSCAGAAGGSDGLAATLVRHGADRVVAMQTLVTDRYATGLAHELYDELAEPSGVSAAAALAAARRKLELAAIAAARAGGLPPAPEHAVPTLFSVDGDPPLLDATAPPERLVRATDPPTGGGVRRLPVGYLIGRRRELRTALAALRSGRDRTGSAVCGVVLSGVGGIGKTALAGRIEARLASEGWLPAVHFGRWNPSALTAAVAGAVAGVPTLAEAHSLLTRADVDDTTKLQVVCQLLRDTPLLVLFDDFEQNLDAFGDTITFIDPGFAEVFDVLCTAAEAGRLLVTSRYPPPDADAFLLELPVPSLSPAELRRLLLRLPSLNQLDAEDRGVLLGTVGGHPRLLEFVNALVHGGGRGNLKDVTLKLRKLAKENEVSLTRARTLGEAIPDAVALASRDIFLEPLVATLTADEHELLLQAAVSRVPFSVGDLAVARWGEDPTPEQRAAASDAAERLIDLTLLSVADGDEVLVHPWIADAVSSDGDGENGARHQRAVAMRLARMSSGRAGYGDLIEISRHLAGSGEFDDLVAFAFEAVEMLAAMAGELSVAAFLGEVVPTVPTSTASFLALADRERGALLNTGSVSAARERADAVLTAARERAEAEPGNAETQRDLSIAYNRLGDLMLRLGDGPQAERYYRDDLAIAERLVAADPANAELERDLSVSYDRLGNLVLLRGDGAQAERYYRDSLAIRERLAAADPADAEIQRDLSISYNRIGDLMLRLGDGTQAERYYHADLAIAERLAAADPNDARAQRDLSVSHNRFGNLVLQRGDSAQAERHYRDSLAIAERLATADPTNVETQRDLSVCHNKLGNLMLQRGDHAQAKRHYDDSLAIRERLAAADPTNAEAQRDLSISHNKLGDLMLQFDAAEAEVHYRDGAAIVGRLAAADPTNAENQRDLSVSHEKLGDLALQRGDDAEAERRYRGSLAIAERLAAADPTNAEAQRDLLICHNNLGDLALQRGDGARAERHYHDSLAIAVRLAASDPTNAEAQRDLSISHFKLGDLAQGRDDHGGAERHFRDGLAAVEASAGSDDPLTNLFRERLREITGAG